MSVDAASRSTRIRPRYLEALEDDAGVDAFPGPIYARFFLKEYARYLGVSDEPLLTAFEERTAPPPPPLRLVPELEQPRRWVGIVIRIAAILFMVAVVAYAVAASRTEEPSPARSVRAALTEVPAYVHRTHASVGTPHPNGQIRAALLVRTPTHVQVFVNGEKVVKRVVQPRRLFFRVLEAGRGAPTIDVEVADGSAVRLVVNGRVIPTQGRTPFHARFVTSFGRTVRL